MGCWMPACDIFAMWPSLELIVFLRPARLPPPSSLDFKEKFIKEKKVSLPHLVLQYPVEKVSSREPEFMS